MIEPVRDARPSQPPARPDDPRATAEAVLFEIRRVIVGQDAMLERVLVALLAGGHLLLEGVPGLAKTLTIRTLADALDASFRRIQFTPDLVPADLVGTRIYRPDRARFDTELGPGVLQLPARRRDQPRPGQGPVRAARGDAGAPGHDRPREPSRSRSPFLVMATQNPIESEGTYPLPEAQVDRFMMKVVVGYPSAAEEATVVERSLRPAPAVRAILDADAPRRCSRPRPPTSTSTRRSSPTPSRSSPPPATPSSSGRPTSRATSRSAPARAARSTSIHAARALALAARPPVRHPGRHRRARPRRPAPPHRPELLGPRRGGHGRTCSSTAIIPAVPAPRADHGGADGMTAPRRTPARGPSARRRSPAPAPTPEALLRALDLSIGRRIRGLVPGEFRAHDLGGGTELAQVRPYEPGDDVRRIDWNVTARMTVPHVRVHVPERALTTWLLLDVSPSMALRHRRPPQGRRRRGRRDRRRPPVDAARQPPRRAHLRRPTRPPVAADGRPRRPARDAARAPSSSRPTATRRGVTSPERAPCGFVARGARRAAGSSSSSRTSAARSTGCRCWAPSRQRHASWSSRSAIRARTSSPTSASSTSSTPRPAATVRVDTSSCDPPRPGSPRPPPAIATTSPASSAGSASATSSCPPPAAGCARSPTSSASREWCHDLRVARAPARPPARAARRSPLYLLVQRRRARYVVRFTNVDLLAQPRAAGAALAPARADRALPRRDRGARHRARQAVGGAQRPARGGDGDAGDGRVALDDRHRRQPHPPRRRQAGRRDVRQAAARRLPRRASSRSRRTPRAGRRPDDRPRPASSRRSTACRPTAAPRSATRSSCRSRPPADARRPRPGTATAGALGLAGAPSLRRPPTRRSPRSSRPCCCPTAPTRPAPPSRSTPRRRPPRPTCRLHDRARHAGRHGRRPGPAHRPDAHARRPAGHRDARGDRGDDRRSATSRRRRRRTSPRSTRASARRSATRSRSRRSRSGSPRRPCSSSSAAPAWPPSGSTASRRSRAQAAASAACASPIPEPGRPHTAEARLHSRPDMRRPGTVPGPRMRLCRDARSGGVILQDPEGGADLPSCTGTRG